MNSLSRIVAFAVSLPVTFLANGIVETADAAWVDSRTGEPVKTVPYTGLTNASGTGDPSAIGPDPDHAYYPSNSPSRLAGHNLYWDKACGTWRDSATGEETKTVPYTGLTNASGTGDPSAIGPDPNHAYYPSNSPSRLAGHNLFWRPCPPPVPPSNTGTTESSKITTPSTPWTGSFIGVQLVSSWSAVRTSEYFATTATLTNRLNDSGSGFGGGINAGYNWQPWGEDSLLGIVFDANLLHDQARHDFAGGAYIGATTDWTASAQVRAGFSATPWLLLYGQTGLSVAGQKLQIDFGGPETNQSKSTPGWTVGGGLEFTVNYNGPPGQAQYTFDVVGFFINYQHTWWDKTDLHEPIASPLFKYSWQRQSDQVEVGIRIPIGGE